MGELWRGRRLQLMFPHELWNINIRVQEDLARTNNELEGWHTRFSSSFLYYHAHFSKFIKKLKQDSSLNHLKMAHRIAGVPNPPQHRIYWEINERLQTPVDRTILLTFYKEFLTNSRNKRFEGSF